MVLSKCFSDLDGFALLSAASSQHVIDLGQSLLCRHHIPYSLLDRLGPGLHCGSHLRGTHYFYPRIDYRSGKKGQRHILKVITCSDVISIISNSVSLQEFF